MSNLYQIVRDYFRQQVYPGFYTQFANRKIEKNYNLIFNKNIILPPETNINNSLTQLKIEFEEQKNRKKTIEDKAKSILATISISITAITFSLNYQKVSFNSVFEIITLILLLSSILYFISGAIRAIQTINIRAFNLIQTNTTTTDTEIKLVPIENEDVQLQELLKAKLLNDQIIIKLSNFAWAAFILVRNGIILFAIYFMMALFQKNALKSTGRNIAIHNDTLGLIINNKIKPKVINNQIGMPKINSKDTISIISKPIKIDTTKRAH